MVSISGGGTQNQQYGSGTIDNNYLDLSGINPFSVNFDAAMNQSQVTDEFVSGELSMPIDGEDGFFPEDRFTSAGIVEEISQELGLPEEGIYVLQDFASSLTILD